MAVATRSDNKGNLGPIDISASASCRQRCVGLSIDAGGFKGGGFLMVDATKGEYAGGLELDFLGLVTVKAVGLLNTKFPDGHRGFSLVIIISAEFPPIQLGFGFTLVGVGGLIGLSRTVDTDAMRESMHQGSLDSVLFPRDIVAQRAAHRQRPAPAVPARRGSLPHRPDGEVRLGHADDPQPRVRPDSRHPAAGVRHHRPAARRAAVPGRCRCSTSA